VAIKLAREKTCSMHFLGHEVEAVKLLVGVEDK